MNVKLVKLINLDTLYCNKGTFRPEKKIYLLEILFITTLTLVMTNINVVIVGYYFIMADAGVCFLIICGCAPVDFIYI
jgi:hypothetical protein